MTGQAGTVSLESDSDLLELAEIVLGGANYRLQRGDIDGQPCLYAENEEAVVAVTCPLTIEHLIATEPLLSRELARRLKGTPTAKRWDAYAVLLTSSSATDGTTEALSAIANDLRHVRRIVRVGVAPTAAGLSRALRPLLPLPSSSSGMLQFDDPISSLRTLLLRDGIDAQYLDRFLTTFVASVAADLDDEAGFYDD